MRAVVRKLGSIAIIAIDLLFSRGIGGFKLEPMLMIRKFMDSGRSRKKMHGSYEAYEDIAQNSTFL
jgi:hypothetical protein